MIDLVTVAVDAMGGDFGLQTTVVASLESLRKNEALSILLVGDQEKLEAFLHSRHEEVSPFLNAQRLAVHHAPDVVLMDEKPSRTLRTKQKSSMAVALRLVRDGTADACVSGGNTGALMVLGRSILGMCPGIDRPAITKLIPSPKGRCYVLDLGANVDSSAEHLYQFALMGAVLVEAIEELDAPRVALINVGQEDIKGSEQVRLASRMLAECEGINYIGYIEGGDLFSDKADVAVCDGFVGNVALKVGEGVAALVHQSLENIFNKNWFLRTLGRFIMPLLVRFFHQIDPSQHNGALFLGLQGVVVKSHGDACANSFSSAIDQAVVEAEKGVPAALNSRLDELLY